MGPGRQCGRFGGDTNRRPVSKLLFLMLAVASLLAPPFAAHAGDKNKRAAKDAPNSVLFWPPPPEATRIEFVQTFSSPKDFGWKRSLWQKFVEWAKAQGDASRLRQPSSVAIDSKGRLIIADPGAHNVKIYDPQKKSVKFLRGYKDKQFGSPISIALDGEDNIYVSDSSAGRVLCFKPDGHFKDFIGGEEGAFKRPAAIVFNPTNQLLYVVDTVRPRIFAYSLDGKVLREFGSRGSDPGQFNFPTFIAIDHEGKLYINDTLNFRVEVFTADGQFIREMGGNGDAGGSQARSKGLAIDSDGHLFIADAIFSTVQIFDQEGHFLLNFGDAGSRNGEFYIPSGITIDSTDRVFVADPFQGRVEIFQYVRDEQAKPRLAPSGGGQ